MSIKDAELDASRYRYISGVTEVFDIDLDEVVVHDQNGVRITEAMIEAEADEVEAKWRAIDAARELADA